MIAGAVCWGVAAGNIHHTTACIFIYNLLFFSLLLLPFDSISIRTSIMLQHHIFFVLFFYKVIDMTGCVGTPKYAPSNTSLYHGLACDVCHPPLFYLEFFAFCFGHSYFLFIFFLLPFLNFLLQAEFYMHKIHRNVTWTFVSGTRTFSFTHLYLINTPCHHKSFINSLTNCPPIHSCNIYSSFISQGRIGLPL